MPRASFRVPGQINANDLEVDSTTLSVDESNNRVGVGTTSPNETLDVVGTIKGSNGVITLTTAGTPTASIANGALAVDTSNDKLFYRSNDEWLEVGTPTPQTPVVLSTWGEDSQANDNVENEIVFNGTTTDQGFDWSDNGSQIVIPEDGVYEIHTTLVVNNADTSGPHTILAYGKIDDIEDLRMSAVLESIPADQTEIIDWHWTAEFVTGEVLSFWWVGSSLDISLVADTIGDLQIFSSRASIALVSGGPQGPQGPTAVINTDGDPGDTIYVGSIDPTVNYSPVAGDVWIELP